MYNMMFSIHTYTHMYIYDTYIYMHMFIEERLKTHQSV